MMAIARRRANHPALQRGARHLENLAAYGNGGLLAHRCKIRLVSVRRMESAPTWWLNIIERAWPSTSKVEIRVKCMSMKPGPRSIQRRFGE